MGLMGWVGKKDILELGNVPEEVPMEAPNHTAYKRWSCHKLLCRLCRNLPAPSNGARFTVLGKPARRTHWLAVSAPHKSG